MTMPTNGEKAEPFQLVPTGRLRLVKVIVQPVLVLDLGEGLSEVNHPAIEIKAADWREFAEKAYTADDLDNLLSQVTATNPGD